MTSPIFDVDTGFMINQVAVAYDAMPYFVPLFIDVASWDLTFTQRHYADTYGQAARERYENDTINVADFLVRTLISLLIVAPLAHLIF